METNTHTNVRSIVVENPQAFRVFEAHRIDYCCGGERPLGEACRNANVAVETVLNELERTEGEVSAAEDWNKASLTALADHIVEKHHGFVRRESARLTDLLKKVKAHHLQGHPELNRVGELFEALSTELAMHMMKEEQLLFPMIRRLEEAPRNRAAAGSEFCSVEFPVRQMMLEHDDAGELLRQIRKETSEFQAPPDACLSFRALYHGLKEFELDLHQHIHLENNILFPRALEATKPAVHAAS